MQHTKDIEIAKIIAKEVTKHNGKTFFVGGFVRDLLRGTENNDIDIEIHGISVDELRDVLDSLGRRIEIGESFGVFGLRGYSIDIAMPRKETCLGRGHRNFEISVDPYCGTLSASKRRDFTINSMMQDVLSGEIIDPFSGRSDLEKGIIRHVDENTFAEDPLRVLRAAQFSARLNFKVANETIELCKKMNLSSLSKERIMGELEKALLKADKPSIFFETLREMEQLSLWFPEIEQLIGIPQHAKYHMEGDVWTHTMMVVDAMAAFREKSSNKMGIMISALVHDFGKIVATDEKDGVFHAYNHETLGLPIIREFLHRLTRDNNLVRYVLNMAEYHMKPNILATEKSSVKSTNKMFDKAICPEDLIFMAAADGLGKLPIDYQDEKMEFLQERLKIYREYMSRPYVDGNDLIAAGISPGIEFKEYLSFAHKMRLAGVDKTSTLRQIQSMHRTMHRKNTL